MGQDKCSESETVSSESDSQSILKDPDAVPQGTKDEKPYKCAFDGCNAVFVRPSRLARHIRFHNGEVMFIWISVWAKFHLDWN